MKILNKKWPSKSDIVQLFSLFFIAFEYLSHFLTFWTLSSSYINGLEEGCAHLPETLTSTYGMKLKLGPVITLDKRKQYMTLSPKMLFTDTVRTGVWFPLSIWFPLLGIPTSQEGWIPPWRYTNADLKISLYVCVHIKTISWKFRMLCHENSRVICPWSL